MRQLRLTAISHMEELWQAVLARRHGKDTSKLRARIQKEWRQLKTAVGQATDRRGHVMPGWVVVANWPSYRLLAALRRWQKLRRQTTIRGGQRTLHSHFARTAPPASAKHQPPSATPPTPAPNPQPPPAAAVTARPTPAPDGPDPSTGATTTARRAPPPPPPAPNPVTVTLPTRAPAQPAAQLTHPPTTAATATATTRKRPMQHQQPTARVKRAARAGGAPADQNAQPKRKRAVTPGPNPNLRQTKIHCPAAAARPTARPTEAATLTQQETAPTAGSQPACHRPPAGGTKRRPARGR